MENKDLELGAKATALNRQQFESAVNYFDALEVARKIRVEKLNIPADGFGDQRAEQRWMNPIDQSLEVRMQRHGHVNQQVRDLRLLLELPDNYAGAVRHLLLQNKIGHIPGNFTIEYTPSDGKIKTEHHDLPKTEERDLENKLQKELFKHLRPGVVARRDRKNAKRDEAIITASKKKGKNMGIDRDLSIVAEVYPSEDDENISRKTDENRAKIVKVSRNRSKKRHS